MRSLASSRSMDALPAGQRWVSWLLLCFCASEAAAQCPTPRAGQNTVLTNEAILMDDFREGTTVSVECANGYERDTGSGNMTCLHGTWSEPDLQCRRKDCGLPRREPNMDFLILNSTLFGDVINVICDEGYQIIGSSYKQCYSVGWVGRARCDIITCEKPAEVTNGRSSWTSEHRPEYGDTIDYSCNQGFTLTGHRRLTCSKTGRYDFEPPACNGGDTDHQEVTSHTIISAAPPDTLTEDVDTNQSTGHTVLIVVLVIVVTGAFIIVVYFMIHLKKTGTYNIFLCIGQWSNNRFSYRSLFL